MHLLMPWFLPLAAGLAFIGSRTARGIYRERGRNSPDGHLMLALAWIPLLVWVVAQWMSKF